MKIIPTALEGLMIIEPHVFKDNRGFFVETYQHARFEKNGIPHYFVQDNLSYSVKDTLRGLHFQINHPQAKLVQTITGKIFDVAVDIRPHSPTFGRWSGVILTERNQLQLYVPEGFAHGFCVLSHSAHVAYKCSDYYHGEDEGGILWSDPTIGIQWPVDHPIVSEKDRKLPLLSELPRGKLYCPVKPS